MRRIWISGLILASTVAANATMPELTPMPKPPSPEACDKWAASQDEDAFDMWGTQESGGTSRKAALSRLSRYCRGQEPPEIVRFWSSRGGADAYCKAHRGAGICIRLPPSVAGTRLSDASGETKRIQFQDEFCDYELPFNVNRDSEDAIKNTILLLFNGGYNVIIPQTFVSKPEDISKIDTPKIDEYCVKRIFELKQLSTVSLDGIDAFKRSLIEEANDTCKFEKTLAMGYNNPAALYGYEAAAGCSFL